MVPAAGLIQDWQPALSAKAASEVRIPDGLGLRMTVDGLPEAHDGIIVLSCDPVRLEPLLRPP